MTYLRDLSLKHAISIRTKDFDNDIKKLIHRIKVKTLSPKKEWFNLSKED